MVVEIVCFKAAHGLYDTQKLLGQETVSIGTASTAKFGRNNINFTEVTIKDTF